jgi:hypothetical protein
LKEKHIEEFLAQYMATKQKIRGYQPIKKFMQEFKKPAIIETIRLNRLCWFGHVQRMGQNRIPNRVLHTNLGTKD